MKNREMPPTAVYIGT